MDSTQASKFLNLWFGDSVLEETGSYLVRMDLPSRNIKSYTRVSSLVDNLDHATKQDIYYGVCSQSRRPQNGLRGSAETICVMPGLWADIDIKGGAHSNECLPGSVEEADSFLEELGVEPTVKIHSGHGLQVYWKFVDPFIVISGSDLTRANTLTKRWAKTLGLLGEKYGWKLDSVHDLSRIFRVPGTVNRKNPDEIVPVDTLIDGGDSYSIPSMENNMVPLAMIENDSRRRVVIPPVKANVQDGIPFQVEQLCDINPQFKRTWEKRRGNEFKSMSEYDFSIANQMVDIGATDQQIADAIYAFRYKYNDKPEKAQRVKYMTDTISKARAGCRERERNRDIVEELEEAVETGAIEDRWAALSDYCDHNIKRFFRIGADQAFHYGIELANGKVYYVGPVSNLVSQARFRNFLLDSMHILPPRMPGAEYERMVEALVRGAETVDTDEGDAELTFDLMRLYWIREGGNQIEGILDLDDPRTTSEAAIQCLTANMPVIYKGKRCVSLRKLLLFARYQAGEQISRPAMVRILNRAGCQRVRITRRFEDQQHSFSYWAISDTDPLSDDEK